MEIDWPDLSFPPVNLWIVMSAEDFYKLMNKYNIPKEDYDTDNTLRTFIRVPESDIL